MNFDHVDVQGNDTADAVVPGAPCQHHNFSSLHRVSWLQRTESEWRERQQRINYLARSEVTQRECIKAHSLAHLTTFAGFHAPDRETRPRQKLICHPRGVQVLY